MEELANSSYLDFTSYGTVATGTSLLTAFDVTTTHTADPSARVQVALVIERAADPDTLLNSEWAVRQTTLAEMEGDGTLWQVFGANASDYGAVLAYLTLNGYAVVGDAQGSDGYVTSAESRTLWLDLTAAQFSTLFGTPLMYAESDTYGDFHYWDGNLSLPTEISSAVAALWPDLGQDSATSDLVTTPAPLLENAQSLGNAASDPAELYPDDIAALYNFPLDGAAYATGTIALNEIGIGAALSSSATGTFQELLDAYRARMGVTSSGSYYVQAEANASYFADGGGERSLDVGVVTAVVPNSTLGLYVGSGETVYTAYQAAIWDTVNNPGVLTSSWSDGMSMNPASPFYTAYRELFVDAALRGMAVFTDSFDGGSGNETANGIANMFVGNMSPYAMVVGGTSLSSNAAAASDETLVTTVQLAAEGDLATLWSLVRGGMRQWGATANAQTTLIETVWNQYYLTVDSDGTQRLTLGYFSNYATTGGVDTTQATPSYQTDFGLTPVSANPGGGTGRGVPDVSALSQGNAYYLTPNDTMEGAVTSGGTSAATPFWASLAAQINFIFEDQGLPDLGYSNDLYYIAASIAPAAFNDITIGNNVSSYVIGGDVADGSQTITPTGIGYLAGAGYDLITGLGTPNGTLLARALSTIAHSQMYFDLVPVLDQVGSDWTTGAYESLLFQSSVASGETWNLSIGGASTSFTGATGQSYAWTAALAQQSLQADFSAELVTLFDGFGQGGLYQTSVAAGSSLAISVAGSAASAYQAALTSDYGFTHFLADDGAVSVARAVAYATTAGGADDQDVVVRLRQNGIHDISVMFYEVDDFGGTIAGIAPGQAGYEAAAAARAYLTQDGLSAINGAGYGAYSQPEITGVDAGDYIAMKLTSNGQVFWAFASANESVNGAHVAHLWSYGLNTWGWEDLYGGGDRDYNDLIVQLDFTSTAGAGLLV